MPFDIELNLRISVNTPEEADMIYAAAFSGMAAELVRLGVLYGQIPFGGAALNGAAPRFDTVEERDRQEARRKASEVELKRVEDKVSAAPKSEVEKVEVKRPSGLAGRKRIRRT